MQEPLPAGSLPGDHRRAPRKFDEIFKRRLISEVDSGEFTITQLSRAHRLDPKILRKWRMLYGNPDAVKEATYASTHGVIAASSSGAGALGAGAVRSGAGAVRSGAGAVGSEGSVSTASVPLTPDERYAAVQDRARIRLLEQENDILKKALGFLCRPPV
jgi:transposase-like protein